jgi:streptogramin lyase
MMPNATRKEFSVPDAIEPRPATSPSPRRHLALASTLLLGGLTLTGGVQGPALALPPYAEEWAIPSGTPEDVDVDPLGRVWVSCSDDSVRVYGPFGGQQLFAFGGSGSGDGQFQDPFGIQFAADGTVYVCDYLGARMERFTSDGTFLLSWPIPSERADHVAVDAAGDVYVTGFPDLSVHKYDASGTPLLDWQAIGGGKTTGILVVGDVVHVAQWDVSDVEQFSLDGTFLGSFPVETAFAVDIEQDALGQLWITDWINGMVRIFSAEGAPVDVLGEPGSGPGQFDGPIGIAFGLDGSVYVADQANGRIQRFGDPVTGVFDPGQVTSGARLRVISSNPFRDSVTLSYAVPQSGQVAVTVADVSGRRVATLRDQVAAAGDHRLTWDARFDNGRPVPPGRYFVRLERASDVSVATLTVLK